MVQISKKHKVYYELMKQNVLCEAMNVFFFLYIYPVQTMNKENSDLYVSFYCYNNFLLIQTLSFNYTKNIYMYMYIQFKYI